jgi:hypothetical protein
MRIQLSILVCSLCFLKTFATEYYVSDEIGNDSNNGLSQANPFKTIQAAANMTLPGDTVYVMNGTYTSLFPEWTVVYIERSGTESNWITYTNFLNHNPLISFTGTGFTVADYTSYIAINGFTIKGNSEALSSEYAQNQPGSCNDPGEEVNPLYNGNGITMYGDPDIGSIHHIKVSNNTIYNSPAAGIICARCDYITIENNMIYNNAWFTLYGSSGIAFYQSSNLDNSTDGYRIVIKNNRMMSNYNLVPWLVDCGINDGNGIIIDDSKHTQNGSTISPYNGRTLITNNVIYGSGGPGVHVYESEHVDIINNTVYFNQQTPTNFNGEIDTNESNDVIIRNNILHALSSKPVNTNINSTNIILDHNIYFGGNGESVNGANTIIQNPKFINPGLILEANFNLKDVSPAIDKGNSELAPATDIMSNPRPFGNGIDIGAYEIEYLVVPYNDDDDDGVINSSDICPNTPSGIQVNVNGCEIFSLPVDNFSITSFGETCNASNNGKILITSKKPDNYTVKINGAVSLTQTFSTAIEFENLIAGKYNVCISILDNLVFEQCYDVTISEIENLSVSSKLDSTSNKLTITLGGGKNYSVELNDKIFTTSESIISLNLDTTINKLTVKTDQECQGYFEETIIVEGKTRIYPNPITNDEIFIEVGNSFQPPISFSLHTIHGTLIKRTSAPVTNGIAYLNLAGLSNGLYLLEVKGEKKTIFYKIFK